MILEFLIILIDGVDVILLIIDLETLLVIFFELFVLF